jgi:benzoate-CoA ligase family protein
MVVSGSSSHAVSAPALGIPDIFNAATYFVDRNVGGGLGAKVAIECDGERITYCEVLEYVNRFGNALRHRLEVRAEERVMLLLVDGPPFAYAFFGAIKVGAVPIPINTLWKPADYHYVLNNSRARVLVVSDTLLPRILDIPKPDLPYLQHIVVVGDAPEGTQSFADLISAGKPELTAERTKRDDVAFWLYSSGSTGSPKGCVHLHHDMVVCSELYARPTLEISSEDRCFSVAKLFFAYGLGNALYFPFAVGATTILWPGAPTAANVFNVIERHHPTLFFSVPTNYAMLLAHPKPEERDFDLSSIRHAVSAGEALPASIFERFRTRFGVEILDGIGSTEILHIFISNRAGAVRPGSSGVLVSGYEARLVDDRNQVVPQGEIGNLLIKGDSICSCYWNEHDKTSDAIEGHWIRTGDKYSQDGDGFFWYAGRSDDMLKVGGVWVSPVEVESALIEHPAVRECAVVAHDDQDALVKPFAYVVLEHGIEGSAELARELQQFVKSKLAEYKRPRWIGFLKELPRTATGKLQRFKLRERPHPNPGSNPTT